ncbi:MAG: MoaD/ThiS family protein [Pseudomonadales bacterium]
MIEVTVRFFGSLRDATGVGQCTLVLDAGRSEALMQALSARFGAGVMETLLDRRVRVAVNQSLYESLPVLASGDEVAFMPPVTGG